MRTYPPRPCPASVPLMRKARRASQSGGMRNVKRFPLLLSILIAGAVVGGFAAHSFLQGQAAPLPAVPKELTSYRDIVKQVLPAVVSIEARALERAGRRGGLDPAMPEEIRKFFEQFEDG